MTRWRAPSENDDNASDGRSITLALAVRQALISEKWKVHLDGTHAKSGEAYLTIMSDKIRQARASVVVPALSMSA